MSGWRLYILGWKVREVCFIFVCQFVSLSVRQFIFIRQFVGSSVRQFVSFIFICQFVRLTYCRLVGLSVRAACRWRGYAFCSAKYIFPGGRVMCSSYRASVCEKNSAGSLISIYCVDYLPEWFVFSPYSACLPLFDDPFWWADFRPRFTDELTNWRTDELTIKNGAYSSFRPTLYL